MNCVPSSVFKLVTRIRIYIFLHHILETVSHFVTGMVLFNVPRPLFFAIITFPLNGHSVPW